MAGESRARSSSTPTSVTQVSAESTRHPRRIAEATKAAPGPRTTAHGDDRPATARRACSTRVFKAARGSHDSQTASAHMPIGAS